MLFNASIAVIPEDFYRKPKGVQFKKSFGTRCEAVEYAQQRGYRVVIACESADCYDVICDPGPAPGPKLSYELVADRGEFVAVPLSLTRPRLKTAALPIARPKSSAENPSGKVPWSFPGRWFRIGR